MHEGKHRAADVHMHELTAVGGTVVLALQWCALPELPIASVVTSAVVHCTYTAAFGDHCYNKADAALATLGPLGPWAAHSVEWPLNTCMLLKS